MRHFNMRNVSRQTAPALTSLNQCAVNLLMTDPQPCSKAAAASLPYREQPLSCQACPNVHSHGLSEYGAIRTGCPSLTAKALAWQNSGSLTGLSVTNLHPCQWQCPAPLTATSSRLGLELKTFHCSGTASGHPPTLIYFPANFLKF